MLTQPLTGSSMRKESWMRTRKSSSTNTSPTPSTMPTKFSVWAEKLPLMTSRKHIGNWPSNTTQKPIPEANKLTKNSLRSTKHTMPSVMKWEEKTMTTFSLDRWFLSELTAFLTTSLEIDGAVSKMTSNPFYTQSGAENSMIWCLMRKTRISRKVKLSKLHQSGTAKTVKNQERQSQQRK